MRQREREIEGESERGIVRDTDREREGEIEGEESKVDRE